MILFYLFICQIIIVKDILCANILYIDPVVSPSHHIWNEVLVAGLLKNGHNITLIGHYDAKINADNYTILKMEGADSILEDLDIDDIVNSDNDNSLIVNLKYVWDYSLLFADIALNSTALQNLLDYPKDHFDLIIFDFSSGQYMYPLLNYFGNPTTVAVSPFGLSPSNLNFMGSHYYSYYPIYVTPYTDNMRFTEKLYNFILYQASMLYELYFISEMSAKAKVIFGQNIRSYDEAMREIGILLVNYDPILDFPQPIPPHIIPVGGLHVSRSVKISSDLQQLLDNAQNGVIYFSFGTNVQASWLTMETKMIFLEVFKKLKQTVLWKYNADDLKVVPDNVIIRKWFPQTDILSHGNVELFITHCGGLSTQESMYHGVPLVAIPIYFDQKAHAIRIEKKSLGRRLNLTDLNVEDLYEAIQEVLHNPKYSRNMRKVSEIFKSQTETPLERAVFWIEYALKHKDLSHLSIKARDMNFIERQNLDIYVFLVVCISLAVIFINNVVGCIFRR